MPATTAPLILEGKPDPRTRWVWFLRGVGFSLFYAIPATIFFGNLFSAFIKSGTARGLTFGWFFLALACVYVVVWTCLFFWSALAVRNYSFKIGAEEVVVRKGVVFRTENHIPLRRVQDIVVKQGPLLRMFGLGTLKLQTAALAAPSRNRMRLLGEGDLPGIPNAQEMAERLLVTVRSLQGDV